MGRLDDYLSETRRTCLYITETGEDDFCLFVNIYTKTELEFLEIVYRIADHLHKHHDKVYYYPEVSKETASSIVECYAEDYPVYTATIRKGIY